MPAPASASSSGSPGPGQDGSEERVAVEASPQRAIADQRRIEPGVEQEPAPVALEQHPGDGLAQALFGRRPVDRHRLGQVLPAEGQQDDASDTGSVHVASTAPACPALRQRGVVDQCPDRPVDSERRVEGERAPASGAQPSRSVKRAPPGAEPPHTARATVPIRTMRAVDAPIGSVPLGHGTRVVGPGGEDPALLEPRPPLVHRLGDAVHRAHVGMGGVPAHGVEVVVERDHAIGDLDTSAEGLREIEPVCRNGHPAEAVRRSQKCAPT